VHDLLDGNRDLAALTVRIVPPEATCSPRNPAWLSQSTRGGKCPATGSRRVSSRGTRPVTMRGGGVGRPKPMMVLQKLSNRRLFDSARAPARSSSRTPQPRIERKSRGEPCPSGALRRSCALLVCRQGLVPRLRRLGRGPNPALALPPFFAGRQGRE
jgi:hypothetical protein